MIANLSRAAWLRVIPFAAFMALLALRGALPADGAALIDARWVYGLTVAVVGALLALWWRDYGELAAQVLVERAQAAEGLGVEEAQLA